MRKKIIRILYSILLIFIFFAYKNIQLAEDYIEHSVELKKELGTLTISLSPKFDTLYNWVFVDCTKCEDKRMFRFANKKYSLLHETWFLNLQENDSLYQFTITQPEFPGCGSLEIKVDSNLLKRLIELSQFNNQQNSSFEIRTINDRDYIISNLKSNIEGKHIISLSATTVLRNEYINVSFDYRAVNYHDFMEEAEKCLSTMKIE